MPEVTVTAKGSSRYFEGVGVRYEGEVLVCDEQVSEQWVRQGWVTKGRKAARKARGDQEDAE